MSADVIARFDEVDIAIVGIGILEPSQLLKTSGNYYHEDMLQVLAERGAVGDICLHYYDKNGKAVLRDDEDPVIGMALEKVKKCPNVVALARRQREGGGYQRRTFGRLYRCSDHRLSNGQALIAG